MASTFIRAFAIMLALTGFGVTTTSPSNGGHVSTMAQGGPGLGGAPICTTTSGSCGLD